MTTLSPVLGLINKSYFSYKCLLRSRSINFSFLDPAVLLSSVSSPPIKWSTSATQHCQNNLMDHPYFTQCKAPELNCIMHWKINLWMAVKIRNTSVAMPLSATFYNWDFLMQLVFWVKKLGFFFPRVEESFTWGTKGPKTDKLREQKSREVRIRAGDKLFICLLTETLTQCRVTVDGSSLHKTS